MSDYAHPEYLVETAWLAEHLDDPALRIFDCTTHLIPDPKTVYRVQSGLADYQAGHIPGAGYLDLQAELSDSASRLRFTMPSAEHFAAAMGGKGLGDGHRVVLYSAGTMWWATRIWWMLRAFGCEGAAVLNGGYQKWQAEERPVSTEPCVYPPASFTPAPRPGLIAQKDDVLAALADPGAAVVNALTRRQHRGEAETHYGRPGRIANSTCLPALDLIDRDSNTFLDAATLREKFAEVGATDTGRTIFYCGGGIAASADAFALALLGQDGIAIYDNSLSEWANDPDLPMETG
ncbi:MAG: sulfurtransferase [Alphaproteobacteria bacterium]|nr:sulfurtransferase [Alphaproteobacteria bacterium]